MPYETYEVFTTNENGDDYYVDLCVAVEGMLECGFSTDDTIYVFPAPMAGMRSRMEAWSMALPLALSRNYSGH